MPKYAEDLTGKVFGRLTVVGVGTTRRYYRATRPMFVCRCECGKEVEVMGQSLRQGKTVSCGCYRHEVELRFADLTGQRFGQLIVLSYAGRHGKQQKHHWRCKCDCGKERIVRGTSLTSDHTTSCGCYAAEQRRKAVTTHGKSGTPEMLATYARVRLQRKRELDSGWTLEMEWFLRQAQPTCVVCGKADDLATDHVEPLSKGHGLRPGNAVTLCQSCNSTKHAKDLADLPKLAAQQIKQAAAQFKEAWDRRN